MKPIWIESLANQVPPHAHDAEIRLPSNFTLTNNESRRIFIRVSTLPFDSLFLDEIVS